MKKKIVNFLLFLFTLSVVKAQSGENILLKRDFWKAKPTLELVQQKVREGNDASQRNPFGFDAIAYALLEKQDVVSDDIIKYLMTQKGNGVNKRTHDSRTYIFWAAYTNRLDLMKYLVSKGAKIDVVDSHGYSVLNFAAVTGQLNKEMYAFLIEKGANPKVEKSLDGANTLLLVSSFVKDFELIDFFIEKGLSINDVDNKGNGIVCYAAKKGNKELIDLLIKKGLPYNNSNGGNAMLMATKGSRGKYNTLDFFKYLEGLGVNANITDNDGVTPLHNLAYSNKDVATISYFLDKGIEVNQQDSEGNTPLYNAAKRNSLEVIELLGKNNENINLKNKKQQTALMNAMNNEPVVVAYFLNKGSDINVEDEEGNNLGYYLANSFNVEKEEAFVEKTRLLEAKGFKITTPQKNGNTLLHIAADNGDLALMKHLKKFEIDVNKKNNEGLTALQKAVMVAKNTEAINYLIENGADKKAKTNFNESIYDLAKENEKLTSYDLTFLK